MRLDREGKSAVRGDCEIGHNSSNSQLHRSFTKNYYPNIAVPEMGNFTQKWYGKIWVQNPENARVGLRKRDRSHDDQLKLPAASCRVSVLIEPLYSPSPYPLLSEA